MPLVTQKINKLCNKKFNFSMLQNPFKIKTDMKFYYGIIYVHGVCRFW